MKTLIVTEPANTENAATFTIGETPRKVVRVSGRMPRAHSSIVAIPNIDSCLGIVSYSKEWIVGVHVNCYVGGNSWTNHNTVIDMNYSIAAVSALYLAKTLHAQFAIEKSFVIGDGSWRGGNPPGGIPNLQPVNVVNLMNTAGCFGIVRNLPNIAFNRAVDVIAVHNRINVYWHNTKDRVPNGTAPAF